MKKKFLYFLGGVIALFLLIGIFAPEPSSEVQNLEASSQTQNNEIESITEAATTTLTNPEVSEAQPTQKTTSLPVSPKPEQKQTQTTPATTQSGGKFYTSSHYSAKYYYPESCDGWKSLSPSYLKSYDTLEALLASYNRTKSPQCE